MHAQWTGIRLYRDGLRVYPYGSEKDDWLGLDRHAMRARGYTLNKLQFIGHVDIGRMSNPALIDQTNREGLRETPEQQVLLDVLRFVVQDQLRAEMLRVERLYKSKRDPTAHGEGGGSTSAAARSQRSYCTAHRCGRRLLMKIPSMTCNNSSVNFPTLPLGHTSAFWR